MLRSSNFQGTSTFVGSTWLRIYRTSVHVFVLCTCQRLTDFQRWQDQPAARYFVTTLASTTTTVSNRQKVFLPTEPDQFCRELMYVALEQSDPFDAPTIRRIKIARIQIYYSIQYSFHHQSISIWSRWWEEISQIIDLPLTSFLYAFVSCMCILYYTAENFVSLDVC